MKTATFDSAKPPAFGQVYARNCQDGMTTLDTSSRAAGPANSSPTPATSSRTGVTGNATEVSRILREVMALWMVAASNTENAKIFGDALNFVGAMPSGVWLPHVWADDAEVVFEWISGDRHAIVSCEGDGVIGYTYRVAGHFVPGQQTAARSDGFPADLAAYLA